MEKNSPPPYSNAGQGPSQHPAAVEADALLDRLTERVNEQHVLGEDYPPAVQAIVDRETERIRNMLEFTLAVDYQGCTTASMSVADHEHFMYINKAMRELRSTLVLRPEDKTSCKQVIPNPEERQVLAAYFWKYLFEPCKALSLPLDFVYESIRALNLYTDSRGRYKGSVFGLLQQFGVESLAAKLYRDRHVLIPLIFTGYASRHRMLHGLSTIQAMYFHSIDGVEGSTLPYPSVRSFQAIQSVKYEANERGVAYASTRKAAIARACKELSTKYWTNVVGQCVDNVLARFKLVKDGKRKTDHSYATWRGDWVSTMGPTRYRRPMDVVVPDGWWTLCSSHVPDYCEFRGQVEMNDC
jgi:hypothetical protein